MNSTWINLRKTYYLGKMFGLFPLAGRFKFWSLLYSLILWISLCIVSVYISYITHVYTKSIPPKFKLLINVINIRIFFKFIVAALSAVVSVHRSKEFFKLIDKFDKFDTISLQTQCSSNFKTQKFYLLYALSVEFYYLSISVYYSDISVVILLIWTLVSASTILMIIQYVVFVGLIRERYRSANFIFASNVDVSLDCTQIMFPKEITNLYNELRTLTDEVKNYYAYHAVLIIIDSILIFISSVTALTLDYTNEIAFSFFHNKLFLIYCVFKMLFLFFIVRETHDTVQEAHKTLFIAHEALSITENTSVIKEMEILIMTCWNHPIVFDVYDFFDLDYKLLQSIIASVVTYVVILVQMQLAISNTT